MSSSSDSGKGNSPTPAQQQITPNHLVPVQPEAALLSHGQRRAHYMDFLYRGPVDFDTLVFDTSVGDISPLECYFNRDRLTVEDLNAKYGHSGRVCGGECEVHGAVPKTVGNVSCVMPRLAIYPSNAGDGAWRQQQQMLRILGAEDVAQEVLLAAAQEVLRQQGEEQAGRQEDWAAQQRTRDWVMGQEVGAQPTGGAQTHVAHLPSASF